MDHTADEDEDEEMMMALEQDGVSIVPDDDPSLLQRHHHHELLQIDPYDLQRALHGGRRVQMEAFRSAVSAQRERDRQVMDALLVFLRKRLPEIRRTRQIQEGAATMDVERGAYTRVAVSSIESRDVLDRAKRDGYYDFGDQPVSGVLYPNSLNRAAVSGFDSWVTYREADLLYRILLAFYLKRIHRLLPLLHQTPSDDDEDVPATQPAGLFCGNGHEIDLQAVCWATEPSPEMFHLDLATPVAQPSYAQPHGQPHAQPHDQPYAQPHAQGWPHYYQPGSPSCLAAEQHAADSLAEWLAYLRDTDPHFRRGCTRLGAAVVRRAMLCPFSTRMTAEEGARLGWSENEDHVIGHEVALLIEMRAPGEIGFSVVDNLSPVDPAFPSVRMSHLVLTTAFARAHRRVLQDGEGIRLRYTQSVHNRMAFDARVESCMARAYTAVLLCALLWDPFYVLEHRRGWNAEGKAFMEYIAMQSLRMRTFLIQEKAAWRHDHDCPKTGLKRTLRFAMFVPREQRGHICAVTTDHLWIVDPSEMWDVVGGPGDMYPLLQECQSQGDPPPPGCVCYAFNDDLYRDPHLGKEGFRVFPWQTKATQPRLFHADAFFEKEKGLPTAHDWKNKEEPQSETDSETDSEPDSEDERMGQIEIACLQGGNGFLPSQDADQQQAANRARTALSWQKNRLRANACQVSGRMMGRRPRGGLDAASAPPNAQ